MAHHGSLEALVLRYPDEEDGYLSLASLYEAAGNSDKVTATWERAVRAIPTSGSVHNGAGYAWLRQGRYPEAIRAFEEYARIRPHEPNPLDSLGEAYMIAGDPEKALEKYAAALQISPTFFNSHRARAWAYGMLGRFDEALEEEAKAAGTEVGLWGTASFNSQLMSAYLLSRTGRYRQASARLAAGIERAETDRNAAQLVAVHALSALLLEERGAHAAGLEVLSHAARRVADIPTVPARRFLGTIGVPSLQAILHARAGAPAEARERLKDLSTAAVTANDRLMVSAVTGEIALAAGDLAAADRAFAEVQAASKRPFSMSNPTGTILSNSSIWRDGLARVRETRGDLGGAIEAYRRLVVPDISSTWTSMLEPRFVLALARLLEKSGDADGARAEYRRFLELWKDADPGLPEVAEARRKVR